jgi:dihydropteroate synthase
MPQTASALYRFGESSYDLTARTYVMGVLNVTPDSFSDGGAYATTEAAVRRGREIAEEGADFIDVGGESTRPGSDPVEPEEELRRILPVIRRLAAEIRIPLSVDTYKPAVADQALEAGAVIVNDITGLRHDEQMAEVVAERGASLVLMHIRGSPKTMQAEPVYTDLIEEICVSLEEGIQKARQRGIEQIIVDPGIGFGKTVSHNLEILKKLREFRRFGYPVMVGPSRKSFLGHLLGLPVHERLEGTACCPPTTVRAK